MPLRDWFDKKVVAGILASGFLGGFSSWYITDTYAATERAEAVQEATQDGRDLGYSEGLEAALEDFRESEPERIQAEFPEIFRVFGEASREAGYALGFDAGVEEGTQTCSADQYGRGFAEGREAGLEEGRGDANQQVLAVSERVQLASRDWYLYFSRLDSLNKLAEALESNPDDQETVAAFLSEAEAVVSASQILRESYQEQSSSFNSTIDALRGALEVRNLPEMRRLSRATFLSAEIKGGIFIDGVRRTLETFESLRTN